MPRERHTQPVDSKLGRLENYDELLPHLVDAEWRGRRWVFERANSDSLLTDDVTLELHRVMFEPLFEWAGKPRAADHGPGGVVNVPFAQIWQELRKFSDDFAVWVAALGADPTVEQIGTVMADAHHRFQCAPRGD